MKHELVIDLDDPRTGKVAEVLSNSSCKRILSVLADREMSESELADLLKMPLNTVGYNSKKLIEAGLIERSPAVFWIVKGKRVARYRVAQKKIVISARPSVRGIAPAVLISGLLALGVRTWFSAPTRLETQVIGKTAESASLAASTSSSMPVSEIYGTVLTAGQAGLWFFLGSLIGLLIILVWNWRRVW
ncbi:helix-turn-helix transcriptional regulator [Candidatus Pacearchaeota archaeon]|nr:helix-turn-helix transcriptional regulator [Candidatus Pacearchaeota archaeon]